MPIETFKPAPQQLAAALKGPIYDSPAPIQQGMTPTAAGASPDAMMANSPFASSFSQGLIDQSMKNQNRSPWELAGNLAMLTSGYYHKSKDDEQLLKRDKATRGYLEQHLPDYVPLWDAADAEQRKEISKQARATILQRAEETRKKAQANADLQGVREALDSGDWQTARKALVNSQDPALAMKGISSGLDDLHEEAKGRRSDAKTLRDKQAAYSEKYDQAIKAGMNEKQARAHAAGIDPNVAGVGPSDDPYATNYDVATTKQDRAAAINASSKVHQENTKKLREQVAGAVRQQRVLQTVEGIIRDPNVYQGVAGDQVAFLKKLGSGLGLDVKGSDKEQLLQSIANDLAKGAREGYPGAVSNFEYQRYLASVISNKNTREGNEAILKYLREASMLQYSAHEDMKEWQRLRTSQGKQAYLDETFDRFHQERQAERVTKLAELEQQAQAARAQAESVTREQRLQSKRGQNAPGASAPSPASTVARPRASNGKQTIEWDGTQWVPVQ